MRGVRTIELVRDGLDKVKLPALARPAVAPDAPRTEELVQWGTNLYAYSVVAHVRKILGGLVQLAHAWNIPAANIVRRHIFEWTAHACYMSSKLKDCYQRGDWEQAWKVLTPAAIGNPWAKQHGAKYAPLTGRPALTVPDPLRIGIAISEYEQYQVQTHGWQEAKDTYGLLSEFSHPNAACLQQYHAIRDDGTILIEYDESVSPLPFVNWCLIDLMLFLDALFQLSADAVVRTGVDEVLDELVERAPTVRT